jgi:hypothetical protein
MKTPSDLDPWGENAKDINGFHVKNGCLARELSTGFCGKMKYDFEDSYWELDGEIVDPKEVEVITDPYEILALEMEQ